MDLSKLTETGEKLGLTGKELRTWIKEQQDADREERARQREADREKREKEKLELEAKKEKERMEMEKQMVELESKREKERMQQEKERLELQAKLEQERFEREQDRFAREKEEKDAEHKRQLEIMEAEAKLGTSSKVGKTATAPPRAPKLPPFDDGKDDMDAYIQRFERYAEVQGWSRAQWAIHLSALLKGKALEAYARMPKEDALDFDKLKAALLIRFELTEEGFKKKFRACRPEPGETFTQFSARLRCYFQRWIELAETKEGDYKGLLDLMLRDQFLFMCGTELRLFLRERIPKTLKAMSELADQYREARGGNVENMVRRNPKASAKDESQSALTSPPEEKGNKENEKRTTSSDKSINDKRRCYLCN